MRFFIFFVSLISLIYGRENPFKPVDTYQEEQIQATNIVRQYDDFEEKEFTLPSSARVLKYIKVGYQALDGSMKEKKVLIDKNIDWHESLVVTKKSSLMAPVVALETKLAVEPKVTKEVKKVVQPKPIQKQIKPLHVKPKKPIVERENVAKSFSFRDFLTFDINKKQLTINTNDSLIRDFIVVKPYKIVLDFKKTNSFYTKTINLNMAPFQSVTFGSHENFYRASFLLDGPYTYTIHKEGSNIIINLH